MRKDQTSDAAVGSSVIAFLVAGVLFMASVVAVLVTTRSSSDEQATGDAPDAAASRIQATNLANLLLESPGYAGGVAFSSGSTPGYSGQIANADELTRLGLLDPDSPEPFMMDFGKFQNLRQAPLAAANDDYVNYEEALRQFGLEGTGVDFHIRSYPNLKSTQDILANLANRDDNLRVAYIGDASSQMTDDDAATAAPPAGYQIVVKSPTDSTQSCTVSLTGVDCPASEAPITCTATTKGYRIATRIVNSGDTATQFEGIFNLVFANGDVEYHKVNSGLVAATTGETTLAVDSAALAARGSIAARSCAGLQVNLKLYDPDRLLFETDKTIAAQPSPAPSTTTKALMVDLGNNYYEDNDNIVVTYRGEGLADGDELILTVCQGTTECLLSATGATCIAAVGCQYREDNVPNNANQWKFTIDDDDLPVGEYTVRLYYNIDGGNSAPLTDPDNAGQFVASDLLKIVANGASIALYDPPAYTPPTPVPGAFESGGQVAFEVEFIDSLMGKFCPYWYDSTTSTPLNDLSPALTRPYAYAPRCDFRSAASPAYPTGHVGDVYPQDKQTLKRVLEERLETAAGVATTEWTDILVIGSNVDHNKLTSQDVKDTIGNWVLAGGTLIVFGSSDMSTHWLESVFHVAIESSSTGINVPDQNHPVLNVPNDLDWPSYDAAYAWRLKVTGSFDAESAFTRVVNDDGSSPNAILAVSDPGAFQAGSVILTGWTPWNIELSPSGPSAAALTEGRNLVHNLLMLGYRDLYLDYGPSLPSKRTSDQAAPIDLSNVVPEIRNAQVCHPDFDDAATAWCDDPIPLRFEIYVF